MRKNIFLKILKYITSLCIAFGIIYLLFKNQDPISLVEEIRKVESKWVVLSMIFGAWAYVIRGLRWIVLIDALGYNSTKINSVAAVSVGYFANIFVPRAGEIARCTSLYQTEQIPVNKLFGTILIERVIDLVFLFFLIFLTIILKLNDILGFYRTLQLQQDGDTGEKTIFTILFILFFSALLFFLLKNWLKTSKGYNKIIEFIDGLKEGFKSIKKMKRKTLFWVHTFSIWIMYFLMTYICFYCMKETSQLTPSDGLFLLVLGGIGMVIPTPGGVGSYHAIVMIGLSVLGVGTVYLGEGGDPTNPALIFPTIVHVAQTLVAIIMGSIGMLVLLLSKKKNNVIS